MTEDRDEEQRKGFKVHDRRRFSESGAPREPGEGAAAEPARPAAASEPAPREQVADQHHHHDHDHDHCEGHDHHEGEIGEINFPTFVISLCTQALAHLGEIPDPTTGTVSPDLAGARQLIDILAMLQEKTHGNLDEDESNLLEHALYDLRIKFVERAQGR